VGLNQYLNIQRPAKEYELGTAVEALLAAVLIDTEHMEPVMRAMVGLGLIESRKERAIVTMVKPSKEQAKIEKKTTEDVKKIIEEIKETAMASEVKEEEKKAESTGGTASAAPILEDQSKANTASEHIVSPKMEDPKREELKPAVAKVEVSTKKEATKKESKIRRLKKKGVTWLEKKLKIRVTLKA
jgi:hypothetical protein